MSPVWAIGICLLVGIPAAGLAQTNSEINAGIQFDFPLPGARSLAMGGAFVALADDATAAVANPAGLTTLVRPEVSVEGRGWRFVSVTPSSGHAFGPASNFGVDTINGIIDDKTADSTLGASFISGVIPTHGVVIGIYRHQQTQYRASVLSEGPFITNATFDTRSNPYTGNISLDIANYGVSIAHQLGSGLSVGGGVAFSHFALDSQVAVKWYAPDQIISIQPPAAAVNFVGPGQTYGPADFSPANTLSTITETGKDNGVAFNLGALYRPMGQKWSLGGDVRINPEFTYYEESRWGPAHPFAPARGTLVAPPIPDVKFKVPDVYSAGAAYHFSDQFLISGQYDRVQFSQLSRNFRDVNPETTGEGHEAILTGLKYPDSNQTRAGLEYSMVHGTRITSLRLGSGFESAHRLVYTQTTEHFIGDFAVRYPKTKGQWHVTPGAGVALKNFQIDAAVDLSDRTQTFSASTVYRF